MSSRGEKTKRKEKKKKNEGGGRKKRDRKKFLIIYVFSFKLTPSQILNNAVSPLKRWQWLITSNELLDKGSTKLLIEIDEAHYGEKSNNFPTKRRLKFWVAQAPLSQQKSWLVWRRFSLPHQVQF